MRRAEEEGRGHITKVCLRDERGRGRKDPVLVGGNGREGNMRSRQKQLEVERRVASYIPFRRVDGISAKPAGASGEDPHSTRVVCYDAIGFQVWRGVLLKHHTCASIGRRLVKEGRMAVG